MFDHVFDVVRKGTRRYQEENNLTCFTDWSCLTNTLKLFLNHFKAGFFMIIWQLFGLFVEFQVYLLAVFHNRAPRVARVVPSESGTSGGLDRRVVDSSGAIFRDFADCNLM